MFKIDTGLFFKQCDAASRSFILVLTVNIKSFFFCVGMDKLNDLVMNIYTTGKNMEYLESTMETGIWFFFYLLGMD